MHEGVPRSRERTNLRFWVLMTYGMFQELSSGIGLTQAGSNRSMYSASRRSRDPPLADREYNYDNLEMGATVPKPNWPKVNSSPSRTVSVPRVNLYSSMHSLAKYSQTYPARAYWQVQSRAGDAHASTKVPSGLSLGSPSGLYRLCLSASEEPPLWLT